MHKYILLIAAAISLGGCETLNATQQRQIALVISKCPVLKTYSQEQLDKAAAEIENLPDASVLPGLVTDYSKLRDACRVANRKIKAANK